MNWFLHVVRDNYMNFTGRARRQEYWMFVLFNVIFAVVLSIVDRMLFGGRPLLSGVLALALFLPSLGVAVRRLHDTDRSGWWLLMVLVPLLNIVVLVFLCLEGTRGPNRFGGDPKTLPPPALPPRLTP